MKKATNRILYLLFLTGSVLTMINIYGVFHSLGNDAIYSEEHTLFKNDIQRNADSTIEKLIRQESTGNREEYCRELVTAVNNGIAHYWSEEGRTKYNLTIPVYENWLLWIAQFINPHKYRLYEFCDYKKALERKVGLCSQHAIIICGILAEKGIDCKIVGLSGHVVTMAEIRRGQYWILDGDYGVLIPYPMKQIEENPSIVEPYYADKLKYNN